MNAIPVSIAAGALVLSGLSALALRGEVRDQAEELGRLRSRLDEALAAPADPIDDPEHERLAGTIARLEEREGEPWREVVSPGEAAELPAHGDGAAPDGRALAERTPEERAGARRPAYGALVPPGKRRARRRARGPGRLARIRLQRRSRPRGSRPAALRFPAYGTTSV